MFCLVSARSFSSPGSCSTLYSSHSSLPLGGGRYTAFQFPRRMAQEPNSPQPAKVVLGSWISPWNNGRPALIVFVANFFLQATGQLFNSKYGALFIKGLGTINQFKMSIISSAINLFVSLGSMCAVDTVGRRFMLIAGGIIQVSALLTMGGLGTVPSPSYEARSAIVAMMVLFGAGFTLDRRQSSTHRLPSCLVHVYVTRHIDVVLSSMLLQSKYSFKSPLYIILSHWLAIASSFHSHCRIFWMQDTRICSPKFVSYMAVLRSSQSYLHTSVSLTVGATPWKILTNYSRLMSLLESLNPWSSNHLCRLKRR